MDKLGSTDLIRQRQGLAQLRPRERLQAVYRFLHQRVRGGILSLTLEVTKRCVARCDFCDHWREPKRDEDLDFVDVVRRLDPGVVVFCGGEPLVRKDIVQIVRDVAAVRGWRYHVLITNGYLLTPQLGLELQRAGLHQLNVSLNWPDERQDAERKLKGLFQRIASTVPQLTAQGVEVNLNTMIMRDNLDQVLPIAELAARWRAKVGYTLYSEYCNGNDAHQFRPEEAVRFAEVMEQLIAFKRRYNNVTNNKLYLRESVEFIRGKTMLNCPAGLAMVHITPQGMVKPCSDLEPVCHYTAYDPQRFQSVGCDMCWMACRGEVQVPVDLERMREVIGL